MKPSLAVCLLVLVGCTSSAPLGHEELLVHWAVVEPDAKQRQALALLARLPAASKHQSGWTYDEGGARERLKVRFTAEPLRVQLGSAVALPLGPEFDNRIAVERGTQPESYALRWDLSRAGMDGRLEARTELAPREEIFYFSIPPRDSAEPVLLIFLALHGPALDAAPKRRSCCPEERAQSER